MHVNLTPFLEKNTTLFMKELWSLLASANQTASHIPQALLEAQKAKLDAQQKAQQAIQASHVNRPCMSINESHARDTEKRHGEKESQINHLLFLPYSGWSRESKTGSRS